jgi:arabinose-5-phosphate isomerase
MGLSIIGIASHRTSLVIENADVGLVLPAAPEACPINIAPTTSTTLQLALGDALAMAVMELRGVTSESLRSLHPGGIIGLRLSLLQDIMHGPEQMPIVRPDASMAEAILTMTSGGFGIAGVTDDDDQLIGVITDGDLRRHFHELNGVQAIDIMTRSPKMLRPDVLAQDALIYLNANKITAAFVVKRHKDDASGKPIGIVHLHDFLRFGLN